jgi:hypothetical protein
MRIAALIGWTTEQRSVVVASFLGWTLDAFDFFLLVFVLKDIAQEFGTGISEGYLCHPADARNAADRRLFVRACCRPVGKATDLDGRCATLFLY